MKKIRVESSKFNVTEKGPNHLIQVTVCVSSQGTSYPSSQYQKPTTMDHRLHHVVSETKQQRNIHLLEKLFSIKRQCYVVNKVLQSRLQCPRLKSVKLLLDTQTSEYLYHITYTQIEAKLTSICCCLVGDINPGSLVTLLWKWYIKKAEFMKNRACIVRPGIYGSAQKNQVKYIQNFVAKYKPNGMVFASLSSKNHLKRTNQETCHNTQIIGQCDIDGFNSRSLQTHLAGSEIFSRDAKHQTGQNASQSVTSYCLTDKKYYYH